MSDQLKKQILELQNEIIQKNAVIANYERKLKEFGHALDAMTVGLQEEFVAAQVLQRKLSPTELPRFNGFEFSSKFVPGLSGGDYFEIFELDDKMRFGIILTSSTGHALSALFMSVFIQQTIINRTKKWPSTENFVSSLIKELQPQMKEKDEFHIFFAIVDRRTFDLEYSSLGEIWAFMQQGKSDRLNWLTSSAGPLTKDKPAQPIALKIGLNPQDRFILMGPGITKSANKKRQYFTKESLQDMILKGPRQGVHETRQEILFRFNQFLENNTPEKDVTVVTIEVKDKVLKLAKTDGV